MVDVKRIDTAASKNLEIALKGLSGKVGRVGWFENSKYPAHTEHGPSIGEHVAAVAAQNEYGNPAKHIPPRSFMRTSIIEKQNDWKAIAESGSKAVLNGKKTVGDVMEAIGLKAAGDIRKKITQIFSPALAERTILARISRNSFLSKKKGKLSQKNIGGLTKPLIDTGIMLNTLTNTVDNE